MKPAVPVVHGRVTAVSHTFSQRETCKPHDVRSGIMFAMMVAVRRPRRRSGRRCKARPKREGGEPGVPSRR